EPLGQQRACPMKAGPYRAYRAAEDRSTLRVRKLGDLAQRDRLAVLDRQAQERCLELLEALLCEYGVLRRARRGRLIVCGRPPALGTQPIEHDMPCAAEEPCAHGALRRVEPRGALEQAQKDVLHHVLRER